MKRILVYALFLVFTLSACGIISVQMDWGNSSADNPTQTPYYTPYNPSLTQTPYYTETPYLPIPTPTSYFTPTAYADPATTAPTAFAYRSADGQRIYWINEYGQIYPLSDSAAAYSSPLVAPDGKQVAYLKFIPNPQAAEGERLMNIVFLADTGRQTEPRAISAEVSDELIAFSPDGVWLLTRRTEADFSHSLHALNTQTNADHLVAQGSAIASPIRPLWAPDSQHIFFDIIENCQTCLEHGELWIGDILGSQTRQLLDENQSGSLIFSPDEQLMMVVGISQAVSFNLADLYAGAGSPTVWMNYERPVDDPLHFAIPEMHWVDNHTIRLALPLTVQGSPCLQIWLISTQGDQIKTGEYNSVETLRSIGPLPQSMLAPLWPENGQRMAINILVQTDGGSRSDILMADSFGANPIEFQHNARLVSWAPDGEYYILFIPAQSSNNLYPVNAFMIGKADNAGETSYLLPESNAYMDPASIRWLNATTYLFETVEIGGTHQFWRGVIHGPAARLQP